MVTDRFRNVFSFGTLFVLVISLTFTLAGCGFFNQKPEADFSTTPESSEGSLTVSKGEEIIFNASSSSDPDGKINSYSWDFGDDASDSGKEVKHSYGSTGTYTVELTVTDEAGATDAASLEITVENLVPPSPPS